MKTYLKKNFKVSKVRQEDFLISFFFSHHNYFTKTPQDKEEVEQSHLQKINIHFIMKIILIKKNVL